MRNGVDRFPKAECALLCSLNNLTRVLADHYYFCEWQTRVPTTVKTSGPVRTCSKNGFANTSLRSLRCIHKNIKIHAHVDYNCDLSIVETPPTRMKTPVTVRTIFKCRGRSYKPTKHCKTVRLWSHCCKNYKNTIKQTIIQLKARRRRKKSGFSH